jgi:hypothetical protein
MINPKTTFDTESSFHTSSIYRSLSDEGENMTSPMMSAISKKGTNNKRISSFR